MPWGPYGGLRVPCAFRNEGSPAREAPASGGKPSVTANDDLAAGLVNGECDPHRKRGSLWDERSAEWRDEAGDRDSLGKGDEPSECHREKPVKTSPGRRLACATLPSSPTACGQDLSAPGGGVTTVLGAPGTPVPSKPSL